MREANFLDGAKKHERHKLCPLCFFVV